ncbi:B-4DMT family transporter [Mycobacterium sp.]|uniref:B-4DMT family transporter n=1 Tax=Mycobacterium sp. TaxID=1785 RepID=UPI003C75421C
MTNWMLRGLVFAAAMVVIRLFQGALINAWQTQAGLISIVLLLIFVVGVFVWGLLDGRADARASRDPDRRQDLAMTWLLAGVVAGVLSGAVSWLIALFYKALYVGGLLNELTTFAAFTALMVFLPGIIGVAVGRWRIDRQFEKTPETHHGLGVKPERGDGDVFTAARGDESPTGEIATARREAHTAPTAVATTERDAPTEVIRTSERDAPTEVIRTSGHDAPTEVIRTTDADQTKPDTKKD